MSQATIEEIFRTALQRQQSGHLGQAEALFRRVLSRQPKHLGALQSLAGVAHQTGRLEIAADLLRQIVSLRPMDAAAHNNLGVCLSAMGRLDPAIAACRRALAIKPDFAQAHYNLANSLKDKGEFSEAIDSYRQAIAFKPQYAQAQYNLGNVLKEKLQFDEAITAYQAAIRLEPGYLEAWNNLGNALREKGRLDEAIAAFGHAIALQPDWPAAHSNLSLALLLNGSFATGWDEAEWRWKWKEFPSPVRSFSQPQWGGESLAGRTILLHAEQGMGDTLQFIRYLPMVAQRGGRIILDCQAKLQPLLRSMAGAATVLARGQAVPAFDYHCPLLSLPRVFATALDNIPAEVPYLHASATDTHFWQERLASLGPAINVGLCWCGNPTHRDNRKRSMPLAAFAPIGQVPGVRFFSLQQGAGSEQVVSPPLGMNLIDWTAELADFADTAFIAKLDLVITVDTATAHLAGALGKQVWTMLPYAPDWRWLVGRDDSPWYPTMRLFRQTSPGDWDGVLKRVADALSSWTKNHR